MTLSVTWWFFMIGISVLSLSIARFRFGKHIRPKSSYLPKNKAPGVSILRPLKGIDNNLFENLASLFRLQYPNYEIIFSVASKSDKSIPVVHDLMRRYPNVPARLITGDLNVGVNPKINNLVRSYESAAHDIIWTCDSNVFIEDPECLGRSVDQLCKPGVGLVHHLPYGVRPKSLGSELELMCLNTVHAKMYLAINNLRIGSCVVGKSNMYRRSDLDRVGGLRNFGKFMAEDNLIATAIWNMGHRHEMTSDLAYQPLGSMTTAEYFLRRSRWTRIRKYTVTAATLVEPFTESIVCGLVASYGFNLLWNIHPLNFFAFHIIVWFMMDLGLFQSFSRRPVDNLRGFIMAWSMREITAFPLYLYAMAGSDVDWRGVPYKLRTDGTAYAVKPESNLPVSSSALVAEVPTTKTKQNVCDSDDAEALPLQDPNGTGLLGARISQNSTSLFHQPIFVTILSSILLVIHILVDILLKSQRNGQTQEPVNSNSKEMKDSAALKASKSAVGKTSLQRKVKRPKRLMDDDLSSLTSSSTEDDDNDEDSYDAELIHAARRYLVSNPSGRNRKRISRDIPAPYPTPSTSPIPTPYHLTTTENDLASEKDGDHNPITVISEISDTMMSERGGFTGLIGEIRRVVTVGLSMHLQNERNAWDKERFCFTSPPPILPKSSSTTSKVTKTHVEGTS